MIVRRYGATFLPLVVICWP